ncbi:MAG: ribosome-associated translation inhibitor RaiA [Bacteriovoracaceae bacterium]|nr:ribosome-associated translation inhibitor RaiA [Bacteriovoracaceae bacterium]
MKVTITFLHLDHTPSLDSRIEEKTEKLRKYFNGGDHIKWTCYVKNNEHYAEVLISGAKLNYHAVAHSDCLYKTLDMATRKLEKQVSKQKEKIKNRIHRNHGKDSNLVILDVEQAWTDYDEDIVKDAA